MEKFLVITSSLLVTHLAAVLVGIFIEKKNGLKLADELAAAKADAVKIQAALESTQAALVSARKAI